MSSWVLGRAARRISLARMAMMVAFFLGIEVFPEVQGVGRFFCFRPEGELARHGFSPPWNGLKTLAQKHRVYGEESQLLSCVKEMGDRSDCGRGRSCAMGARSLDVLWRSVHAAGISERLPSGRTRDRYRVPLRCKQLNNSSVCPCKGWR